MAEKGKVKLPASTGGIMQYYDEYTSKIHITPWQVVIGVLVLMVLVVLLHVFGRYIFGF